MKKLSMMFIALLAAMTMSANKFARVTTAPEDWSGQYLIAYHTDSVEYLFNCKDENDGYVKAYATGDTIFSDVLDNYVVEVAKMTSGYSVKVVSLDKYMSGTSGTNSLVLGTTAVLNTIAFHKVDSIDMTSNTSMFSYNPSAKRFRYYKPGTVSSNGYGHLTMFKVMTPIKPEPWTPDTISVSEARQLIATSDPLMKKSHYIKGVVASSEYGKTWPGWAMIWMTDIDNPADSLEGYKIYKDANSTTWASAEEIPCGMLDTIMLFADGLDIFKGKSGDVYETSSGYFVSILGKASIVNANGIFKYGYGAVQHGLAYDSTRYKYELVLSAEEDVYDNALHLVLNSTKQLGIAGTYTIKNLNPDSSFVDGKGPVGGSATIAYVADEGQVYNKYSVKANFTCGGTSYSLDTTYSLSGWYSDQSGQFKLNDDVPYLPKDGDTITCAQAASYASSLTPDKESSLTVYVHGYATGCAKVSGRSQQSVYMADDDEATDGIFEGYLCYTQRLDSIIKGDEVLVKGKIQYSTKGSIAEISKGKIYRIGGSNTQRPRDPQIEAKPAGAITVAEALTIGNALTAEVGQTVETTEEYTVAGYIVDVNYQTSKDTASWYMADEKGAYGDFKAYKCQIKSLICEDDEVYVTGKISKFQETTDVAKISIGNGKAGFISIASDIREVAATIKESGAKKVLMRGELYIIKDGVVYNAQGAVIR